MTWASASSTKLCRPRDDCRKQCQLPVQYLLLSCWVFLFQIWKLDFQLVGFAELQSRFVSQDLKMRYVAAAALAALGGQDVNEANIKKILR